MLESRDNVERKLRQKMRMHPTLTHVPHPVIAAPPRRDRKDDQNAEQRRYEDVRRKAIVSVYGQDLSSEDNIDDSSSGKTRRKNDNAA